MMKLNIHQAKTHLPKYLTRLKAGDCIVLCKRNQPVAKITPLFEVLPPPVLLVWLNKRSLSPRHFLNHFQMSYLMRSMREDVRCLLDTCTFLWIIAGSQEVSPVATKLFVDPAHEILLSVVSVWEISVKYSLGELPLPASPDRFVAAQRESHGISVLPLEERAVFHLHKLPALHRDPFDRMLVCQAIEHDCVLLTPDPLITQYPVRTQW